MRKLIVLFAVLLTGNIAQGQSEATSQAANDSRLELDQKLAELKILHAEIERLRHATGTGPQQVLIHVQIWEVNRTKLESSGFATGPGGIAGFLKAHHAQATSTATANADRLKSSPQKPANQSFEFSVVDRGDEAAKMIESWARGNLARLWADPTLATVEGHPTSFNCGEEAPVLIPTGRTVAVQYRRYGTELGFTPTLLDDGAVRLQVRPRIRDRDAASAITVAGQTFPGTRVRELDAVADLRRGQTLVVVGTGPVRHEVTVSENGTQDTAHRVDLLMLVSVEVAESKLPSGE